MLSLFIMALATLMATSALRRLPLMSMSCRELLVIRASAIAAPPSGPNPFQARLHFFNLTFSCAWKTSVLTPHLRKLVSSFGYFEFGLNWKPLPSPPLQQQRRPFAADNSSWGQGHPGCRWHLYIIKHANLWYLDTLIVKYTLSGTRVN